MSNSKLTAAQAARYLGSEIVTKEGIKGVLVGIFLTHGSCNIELPDGSISVGHLIPDCQLLLTPLSAITDEHAIEVANLINLHHPFSEPLRFDCGLVKMGYQLQPNKSSSLYNYDVIDLLRSLGYDCDNAISEGWAVDKTTLKL